MIRRDAEEKVRELSRGFPVVPVIGPCQSGKATLVKAVFPDLPYVLLEDPDTRLFAEKDPRGFLSHYEESGAILDEVQRVPELFSYLQGVLDRNKMPAVAHPDRDQVWENSKRRLFQGDYLLEYSLGKYA